ncbi:Bug family tripartite tricarboxylate transporter substrate binding protein [Muricoccus radiodurans]|uniref:Bug family tripartite tricarboxylate transporter substrate binding protein n=1 Tax=Muricoccus radiodurans TaxID=2231721 RepID=UPI003CE70955
MNRRGLARMALAGAALAVPGLARAQGAARPVRLIVPFAAGGPADIFGRIFAEALAGPLAAPVVVENRGGAGSLLGIDAVAKSAPDGLTLGFAGAGALAIGPAMPSGTPFDAFRDLAHLTLAVRVPEVLCVTSRGPHAAGFRALVAAGKAQPGTLNYGSAGVGSILHLACALFAQEAGFEATHVPYRGAAPASTDLLAGRLDFMIADIPVLKPHVDAGGLKALAVTTANRVASLPDVPTMAELGLPKVNSDNWYGLTVPAATPPALQDRITQAALAALRSPELVRQFEAQSGLPSPMGREDYLAFLRAEGEKWGPIVRATGVTSL